MPRIHASSSLVQIGAVIASLASSDPLSSQEIPAETKLSAGAGVAGDEFGAALALDGDVLVVAAPGADVAARARVRSTSSCAIRPAANGSSTSSW